MASLVMGFFDHLEELRQRIFKVLYVFLPVLIFVTSVEVHFAWFSAGLFAVPLPVGAEFTYLSGLASQVFRAMIRDLVPTWISVQQLSPAEGLSVQFKMGIFLTTLLTMPWLVYQAWKFVAPALYQTEKTLLYRIVVPGTILFTAGAVFAYKIVLPFTFPFLYGIGLALGAQGSILRTEDFLDIVLVVMAGMGAAFQTPLVMWGLTRIGLVDPSFWRRNWRFAVVGFFIFGAIVTPDGSGVTMLLVALPMALLYGVGLIMATASARRAQGRAFKLDRRTVVLAVALVLSGVLAYLYFSAGLPLP